MPTYACPCGQKFAGEGLAGKFVVCQKCGRRSQIPGALAAPPVVHASIPNTPAAPSLAQLPFDLLDDLAASQQPPPSDDSAATPGSKKKRQPKAPARSRAPHQGDMMIDWSRFLPAVVGLLLFLGLGITLIVAGPALWKEATASAGTAATPSATNPTPSTGNPSPSAVSPPPSAENPTPAASDANVPTAPIFEPAWEDAVYDGKSSPLPSDAVDYPQSPLYMSGFRFSLFAHQVEQGLTVRLDMSTIMPTTVPHTYSLGHSELTGATIDPQSGLFEWTAPIDFPLGQHDFIFYRHFTDMREIAGKLVRLQILPSQGPLPREGQLAPQEPSQTETTRQPFDFRGTKITPLAEYSLSAVVLSSKFYTSDAQGHVCPIDLALGWGALSDESLLRHFEVTQDDRHALIQHNHMAGLPWELAKRSYANVHIVPSTKALAELLSTVERGDVVQLSGALVEVRWSFGIWHSSLVRTDEGDRACEVMWVDHAEIVAKPSESE